MCAVADKDLRRLDDIQCQYPFLAGTTDAMCLFDRADIDAVAIATPVHTHFDLAKAAIERGKHVLIEKPMTHSVKTSEQLIELADRAGVTLMVDHTFIYTGAVRKLREIVNGGDFGELYYFDSVRVNLGLFQHDINVLWDLAPHDISIMDYVLQREPLAVAAHAVGHFPCNEKPIEDIAYLTIHYPNNLIGHIHVNWLAPVKVRKTLICGAKRMIVYDDIEPTEKIKVYDKGVAIEQNNGPDQLYKALVSYRTGDMYAPNLDQTEALNREVEHFLDCIANGTRPITDGHAGLKVVRILEAAQKSINEGGALVNLDREEQING